MTNKLEITILKEDILLDNYISSRHCPITKALQRANREDLRHTGLSIQSNLDHNFIIRSNNLTYTSLVDKLFSMYGSLSIEPWVSFSKTIIPAPIETFTHTLIW